MPEKILGALITACMVKGFHADPINCGQWLGLGLGLWLGFETLLRTSELIKLVRSDLRLPSEGLLAISSNVV